MAAQHSMSKQSLIIVTYIHELSYSVENCFEVATVEIKVKHGQDIIVACLYRPPNVSVTYFMDTFVAYLNKIKNKKVFICGDYNIDLSNSESDYDTGKFLDLMLSYGQYPLIKLPTRYQGNSCTVIDNIFTNITEREVASNIVIDDITDHLPVMCVYNDNIGRETRSNVVKKRMVTEKNMNCLVDTLSAVNWNDLYDVNDANSAYKMFSKKLISCFNKCCPVAEIKVKRNTNKPWLTKGLINACRKKIIYINVHCKQNTKMVYLDI